METRSTPRLRCMRSHSGAPAGPAPNLRLLYRERHSFQKGGQGFLNRFCCMEVLIFLATRRSGDPLGPASASIRSLPRDLCSEILLSLSSPRCVWRSGRPLATWIDELGTAPAPAQSQVILQKVWGPPGKRQQQQALCPSFCKKQLFLPALGRGALAAPVFPGPARSVVTKTLGPVSRAVRHVSGVGGRSSDAPT